MCGTWTKCSFRVQLSTLNMTGLALNPASSTRRPEDCRISTPILPFVSTAEGQRGWKIVESGVSILSHLSVVQLQQPKLTANQCGAAAENIASICSLSSILVWANTKHKQKGLGWDARQFGVCPVRGSHPIAGTQHNMTSISF